ncbi:hypothetical protein FXV77_21845, partial [Sphingobacterium phlebotomi]
GSGGGGMPIYTPPPASNDVEADDLPTLCFDALWNSYPENGPDGNPAHPSGDDYANQCAIRVGSAMQEVYDIDFSSYGEEYDDPLSSEGYPIRATNLKNYIVDDFESKGMGSSIKTFTSEDDFLNSDSYGQTGFIFMRGGGANHIDMYNAGQIGSLWLNNPTEIVFIPVSNAGCQSE